MKREIKFRVWNGQKMETNIMAGFLGVFYVQGIDESDTACMSPYNTKYPEPSNVMQFTGLKDKNGIEIYEGDILSTRDKNDLLTVNNYNDFIYNVIYSEDHSGLNGYMQSDIEIIGNIFENKREIL